MAHPLLLLVSSPSLFLKVIFLLFFQAQRLKYNLELEVAAVGVCVCGGEQLANSCTSVSFPLLLGAVTVPVA